MSRRNAVTLAEVLRNIAYRPPAAISETDLLATPVTQLDHRAQEIKPGGLFVALSGKKFDGRTFLEEAQANGAIAAVVEGSADIHAVTSLPLIVVDNSRKALALAACNFYGNPGEPLQMIGITGTNGKTSVCWIIAQLLARLGRKEGRTAAYVGTLGSKLFDGSGEELFSKDQATTTPDPIELNSFLAEAIAKRAFAAAVEVSSIGIEQFRTFGTPWNAGVFTNITHDHLDYHGTFSAYQEAKLRFFTEELAASPKPGRVITVNGDDPFSATIVRDLQNRAPELSIGVFSTDPEAGSIVANARITEKRCSTTGTEFTAEIFGERLTFASRFVGDYNVSNVLAAITCLVQLGYSAAELAAALPEVAIVPGRLELVAPVSVAVYVDYAHTPDGLERAQRSVREIGQGNLITVFGCGGDRDRTKRPVMGKIVGKLSDRAIVTSDNPRTENPDEILRDIVPGLVEAGRVAGRDFEIVPDRREAIRFAISSAAPGDTVLVAGKGHEPYQEVNGIRHPFSDRRECLQALQAIGIVKG